MKQLKELLGGGDKTASLNFVVIFSCFYFLLLEFAS